MNLEINWNWGLDGCARWQRPAQGPWQGAKEFKKIMNKIWVCSNFQINLKTRGVKWAWGLDGCARWRRPPQGPWLGAKEFKTMMNKIWLGSNFQRNLKSLEVQWRGGLYGSRGGARLRLQLQ